MNARITDVIYENLLERFGEPLSESSGTVCERCGISQGECACFVDETEKKSPSKRAAKSWTKGTKTFKEKVKKAKSAGMKNPEGFAAWMQHRATGKWPSES